MTMTVTLLFKFAYMAHHFICYSSIPVTYDNGEGWQFQHCVIVAGLLVNRRCLKRGVF